MSGRGQASAGYFQLLQHATKVRLPAIQARKGRMTGRRLLTVPHLHDSVPRPTVAVSALGLPEKLVGIAASSYPYRKVAAQDAAALSRKQRQNSIILCTNLSQAQIGVFGRAVKATDSKSVGFIPRRFE